MAVAVGAVLPSRESVMWGSADARDVLSFAARADALGLDSVWIGDSLTHRPRYEPLTMLAAVAACTERVTVGTAVLLAAMRHPVATAHAIATIDRVASGRVVVGVGAGWIREEFEVVDVPFRERSSRTAETIRSWRYLWRPADTDAPATRWSYPNDPIAPAPCSPGGPPVWMGGSGPLALRSAGELADGWIPTPPDVPAFVAGWARVGEHAEAAGRDLGAIVPAAYLTVHVSADRRAAREEMSAYAQAYYGIPLDVMERFQAYHDDDAVGTASWLASFVEAGARHLVVRFAARDPRAQLERFASDVLPLLRG